MSIFFVKWTMSVKIFEVKYKKGKCAGDGTGRKLKQKEA